MLLFVWLPFFDTEVLFFLPISSSSPDAAGMYFDILTCIVNKVSTVSSTIKLTSFDDSPWVVISSLR